MGYCPLPHMRFSLVLSSTFDIPSHIKTPGSNFCANHAPSVYDLLADHQPEAPFSNALSACFVGVRRLYQRRNSDLNGQSMETLRDWNVRALHSCCELSQVLYIEASLPIHRIHRFTFHRYRTNAIPISRKPARFSTKGMLCSFHSLQHRRTTQFFVHAKCPACLLRMVITSSLNKQDNC